MKKKSFVSIDKYRLDDELAKQPKLYRQYADQLAVAEDRLTRLENHLELVKAQVAHRIRTNPKKYKLSKVTDPSIKEAVIRHPDFQNAQSDVSSAKFEVGVLKAAVRALEHRKRSLEKLTDLHLADYFSEPRPSKNASNDLTSRSVRKGFRRENMREEDDDHDSE